MSKYKTVPFLNEPKIHELLKYSSIPCFNEMKKIVLEETKRGNKIVCVGDASGHPSETYVIIDFCFEAKCDYENLKLRSMGTKTYQYLCYSDNKGAFEIDFGRIKNISSY